MDRHQPSAATPSAKTKPAARMGPLQFGFPWILAFTLACGVLFTAVSGAGDRWLLVVGGSLASFLLALGVAVLRVLAVERTQVLEARRRCRYLEEAARGAERKLPRQPQGRP